jgi:hypothetical protein
MGYIDTRKRNTLLPAAEYDIGKECINIYIHTEGTVPNFMQDRTRFTDKFVS